MNWYWTAFKNYTNFSGRACRAEYWSFYVGNFILGFLIGLGEALVGSSDPESIGFLSGAFSLLVLLPSISVTARRLHDTGRSGWKMLYNLIPIAGPFFVTYWLLQEGKKAPQRGYTEIPATRAA